MRQFKNDIIDPKHGRSANVVLVATERQAGHHICLIDGDGYATLLAGRPAPCVGLEEIRGAKYRLRRSSAQPADAGGGLLGAPLRLAATSSHRPIELVLDLEGLDRGSAAHECAASRLLRFLSGTSVQ